MRTFMYLPRHLSETATTQEVRGHLASYVTLGVLLIVLGVAAIAFPVLAAVAATLTLGWILLVAGIARIVHGVHLWHTRGSHVHLASAVLIALVGGLILFYPLPGALTLTALIAALFMAGGVFRVLYALQWRPAPGWLWLLSGGLVSLALGVLIAVQGPAMAIGLIGLIVGLDLIFSGWWTLARAFTDSAPA